MRDVLPENSFPERIKTLINISGNKEKLWKVSGISAVMIGKYETGQSEPSRDKLIALSVATGVNVEWLVTGNGAMRRGEVEGWPPEGYVSIPRYEIKASAGAGAMVHSEQIVDVMSFKSDWLKVSLGLSPASAAVISVYGDSMEPYLTDGDLILIDTGVNRVSNNAVYVIQYGDSLLVKRIQLKGDDTVIVKSDNPHYEPETFRGDAAERLRVVGRMVRRLVR